MVKKKGSILIETVGAVFILVVCIQISLKVSISLYKSIDIRNSSILLREGLNAVCSDIKYNVRFEEISKLLQNGEYEMLYDEKFNEKISEINLNEMATSNGSSNYIRIQVIDTSKEQMKINVKGKYKGAEMEQTINKAPWMDEV